MPEPIEFRPRAGRRRSRNLLPARRTRRRAPRGSSRRCSSRPWWTDVRGRLEPGAGPRDPCSSPAGVRLRRCDGPGSYGYGRGYRESLYAVGLLRRGRRRGAAPRGRSLVSPTPARLVTLRWERRRWTTLVRAHLPDVFATGRATSVCRISSPFAETTPSSSRSTSTPWSPVAGAARPVGRTPPVRPRRAPVQPLLILPGDETRFVTAVPGGRSSSGLSRAGGYRTRTSCSRASSTASARWRASRGGYRPSSPSTGRSLGSSPPIASRRWRS